MTAPDIAAPLRITVIIGSTREGRVGGAIGRWFADQAKQRAELALTVLDLADFTFPDRYPLQASPQIAEFAAEIGRAEAFVVVTPEYNRSFPASLKEAIDYAYDEWRTKPVGFVSYGCRSEGLYAVEQLRTIFTELHTVTMRDGVSFNLLDDAFDGTGRPLDPDGPGQAASTLLDELSWWGHALRDARLRRPYVS